MVGSIVGARRGLTTPAVTVVAAVHLQDPNPCTSSGFDPFVELLFSRISVALVTGAVLLSALSSICSAVLVMLPGQLEKVR